MHIQFTLSIGDRDLLAVPLFVNWLNLPFFPSHWERVPLFWFGLVSGALLFTFASLRLSLLSNGTREKKKMDLSRSFEDGPGRCLFVIFLRIPLHCFSIGPRYPLLNFTFDAFRQCSSASVHRPI